MLLICAACRSETNAARASHPSRIVIADVPDCRLPPGTEDNRARAPKSTFAQCRWGSRLRLRNSALPSCLGGGFRRRPQCLGSGSLDMNWNPRRFTLERIAGNTEFWPAAPGNFARFGSQQCAGDAFPAQWQTASPLCKRCGEGKVLVERI